VTAVLAALPGVAGTDDTPRPGVTGCRSTDGIPVTVDGSPEAAPPG